MREARSMRLAGGLATGWGAVMLCWAAYNCFWQAGFGVYVRGIFYYGGSSIAAETGSLNYAVLYLGSGILLLRGRSWARGVVAGVALVEGYNRVRSLTGALLDEPQRRWFTGTTEGWLKLVTFALGVAVTAALVAVVLRALQSEARRSPELPLPQPPYPVPFQQPAWPPPAPQPMLGPQSPWPQQPPAGAAPPQQWPAPPGPPLPGHPPQPGTVPPGHGFPPPPAAG
ncbi:hypothetical protein ACWGB8_15145 [Kitasatospora sp. NPDC054939]